MEDRAVRFQEEVGEGFAWIERGTGVDAEEVMLDCEGDEDKGGRRLADARDVGEKASA